MSDNEIVEVLHKCHPIYNKLHNNKISYDLSEQEIALLRKFKFIWEVVLCCWPELIKECDLSNAEIAFLAGYVYFAQLGIETQPSII